MMRIFVRLRSHRYSMTRTQWLSYSDEERRTLLRNLEFGSENYSGLAFLAMETATELLSTSVLSPKFYLQMPKQPWMTTDIL